MLLTVGYLEWRNIGNNGYVCSIYWVCAFIIVANANSYEFILIKRSNPSLERFTRKAFEPNIKKEEWLTSWLSVDTHTIQSKHSGYILIARVQPISSFTYQKACCYFLLVSSRHGYTYLPAICIDFNFKSGMAVEQKLTIYYYHHQCVYGIDVYKIENWKLR